MLKGVLLRYLLCETEGKAGLAHAQARLVINYRQIGPFRPLLRRSVSAEVSAHMRAEAYYRLKHIDR
jgi:hypothetical protein